METILKKGENNLRNDINIIIFGGYVNGYSIARTIKETYDIKPIILDYKKLFSSKSKLCDFMLTYDPKKEEEKFLEHMKVIGQKLEGKKNIIFVTNDEWLIPLSIHRKELEKYFIYTFSDWEIIKNLTIKKNLYRLCEDLQISFPKTQIIDKESIYKIKTLKLPILLKPSNVVNYIKSIKGKRNNVFNNYDDALSFLKICFEKYNDLIIAQEYIPGGVENLYTASTYSNKVVFKKISIGYRLSQYLQAGTITSGY